ncbi:MAG: carboxypeptidase-like regulatory domain-containing protein [Flavobacteriaceae bacterium]
MKKMDSLLKRFITLSVTLFITSFIFSQTTNNTLHEIKGKVTYRNLPLSNVNLVIKGTQKGTKTDSQGKYVIKAKTGDTLVYTYVGFNAVSIIIEDITTVLNIEMDTHISELKTVVITKNVKKVEDLHKVMNVDIKTSFGNFNPLSYGRSVLHLNNSDLKMRDNSSLEAALSGISTRIISSAPPDRILYIRKTPARYEIDGLLYERTPALNFDIIEQVFIIKDRALVIVRTKNAPEYLKKKRDEIIEKNKNHNYYKNDAVTLKKKVILSAAHQTLPKKSVILKEISGKITYLNKPLPDVNIKIKNRGTRTDVKGNYIIKAEIGAIIQYSHLGFKTISLIVEDVTKVLNINMIPKTTILNKVEVTANVSRGKTLELTQKAEKKFNSSRGAIDPKKAGYTVSFVGGDDIEPAAISIKQALVGKITGYSINRENGKAFLRGSGMVINYPLPALWEVDGIMFDDAPEFLELSQIIDVHALKSLASTTLYGSKGAGGVIVIRTKNGNFNPQESNLKKITEKYTNKNYYANDAVALNTKSSSTNVYTLKMQSFNNIQKAYNYYNETLKGNLPDYDTYLSIAQTFNTYYNNTNVTLQILEDVANMNNKNPEVLKTIAYQLQALGFKKETIKTYENIFKLRPTYAQSYRDLANAYLENDQYKKAWRMYMSYLFKGNNVSGEGIGQTLYNEMEWLYFNRKNQTAIKERFIPKNKNITEFRNDVRLVFEWNTSEAEFDLEFVNPDKRAYVFEHSLEKNQTLITDEKKKGYSSKEFFIDDIGKGEWLVNITYKGNKKPESTHFKVSQYFNWGKSNQFKKTAVYVLKNERQKIQLFKLNKQLLVTTK